MLLVRVVRTWETGTDGGISGQKAQVEATVGENGGTGIFRLEIRTRANNLQRFPLLNLKKEATWEGSNSSDI